MSILFASNERKDEIAVLIPALEERGGSVCELCGSTDDLRPIEIPPCNAPTAATSLLSCATCRDQAIGDVALNGEHWRCLNDAIWSETEAVQVLSWRLLTALKSEPWAKALLDQMYLEEDAQAWAEALEDDASGGGNTKDSNGTLLATGDTVTLIKDLDVKGAGFTAKRGTVVKNISLCANPEHIEGRVNGTRIVLKTCFLKKA